MEKLRSTRIVVASKERLVVWLSDGKDLEQGKTSVECPHCGEEAIVLQLERTVPEIKIAGKSADSEPQDR